MQNVLVIGSYNVGLTVRVPRIPRVGETLLGDMFHMGPGGKGSNQAIAIGRLSGQVTFLAKVGADSFGRDALALFERENLDARFVSIDEDSHTGAGIISLDPAGQNAISVAPGANFQLTPDDIDAAEEAFKDCGVLLMQLETPIDIIVHAAKKAKAHSTSVILNPAPAAALPADLYPLLDIITPNESEATELTGVDVLDIDSAIAAGRDLCERGTKHAIVTLGDQGCVSVSVDGAHHYPARVVQAVDTTGAGDAYNGGLAFALSRGDTLNDAIEFATTVAGISVTRVGTVDGLPTLDKVTNYSE